MPYFPIQVRIHHRSTHHAHPFSLGDSYGVSGAFYSQLAEFDLATNQTKYADTLQQYFSLASTTLSQQFQAQNFTGEL
jgi:hypothetical protein